MLADDLEGLFSRYLDIENLKFFYSLTVWKQDKELGLFMEQLDEFCRI